MSRNKVAAIAAVVLLAALVLFLTTRGGEDTKPKETAEASRPAPPTITANPEPKRDAKRESRDDVEVLERVELERQRRGEVSHPPARG